MAKNNDQNKTNEPEVEATEVEADSTNDDTDEALVPVLFKVTSEQRGALKLIAAAQDSTVQGVLARLTEKVISENQELVDFVRRAQAAA